MQQSYEEIKKAHPDEWLILGDPVMADDGINIVAAELLYHSADKRELAYREKPLMKGKRFAIRYNCTHPHKKTVMVSVHTVERTLYPEPHTISKSIYAQ